MAGKQTRYVSVFEKWSDKAYRAAKDAEFAWVDSSSLVVDSDQMTNAGWFFTQTSFGRTVPVGLMLLMGAFTQTLSTTTSLAINEYWSRTIEAGEDDLNNYGLYMSATLMLSVTWTMLVSAVMNQTAASIGEGGQLFQPPKLQYLGQAHTERIVVELKLADGVKPSPDAYMRELMELQTLCTKIYVHDLDAATLKTYLNFTPASVAFVVVRGDPDVDTLRRYHDRLIIIDYLAELQDLRGPAEDDFIYEFMKIDDLDQLVLLTKEQVKQFHH